MASLKRQFIFSMIKVLIVQRVFSHYRRDFYNGLLNSKKISLSCIGETCEIEELSDIFQKQKFSSVLDLNIFVPKFYIEILKNQVIVFPADLRQFRFIFLGYLAILFRKKVIYFGHFKGKQKNLIIGHLRKIYYLWPFYMLIYYKKETNSNQNQRIFFLNNTVNTNSIERFSRFQTPKYHSSKSLTVAFIGRETTKSNYNLFIKVAKKLNGKNFKFKSIGPEIKDLNFIEEYGPIFDEREIANIFNEVDITFYPGDIGLSLIHSFCYATPILIHDQFKQHYPEVTNFEEGKNGLLYKYDSFESAVNVLNSVQSNREQLTKMSSFLINSRDKFSVNRMISNFELAICNVVF
jgi:glycosyltransferase involved in cell wall biosynthesis